MRISASGSLSFCPESDGLRSQSRLQDLHEKAVKMTTRPNEYPDCPYTIKIRVNTRVCRTPSGYFEPGRLRLTVNTLVGSNPRSTCINRTKLLIRSPAPASNAIANATSVTTSILRNQCRPCRQLRDRLPSAFHPISASEAEALEQVQTANLSAATQTMRKPRPAHQPELR